MLHSLLQEDVIGDLVVLGFSLKKGHRRIGCRTRL